MRINLVGTIFMMMTVLAFFSLGGRAESLSITKMIQGTVKEANDDFIKIIEDPDGKEAQIAIDSNTVYDSVYELTDLKAGDKVQVDYKTDHHQNTAVTITRIEAENEDSV